MKVGDLIRSRYSGEMGLIIDHAPTGPHRLKPRWEVMWMNIPAGRSPTTYEWGERLTTVLDVFPRGLVNEAR